MSAEAAVTVITHPNNRAVRGSGEGERNRSGYRFQADHTKGEDELLVLRVQFVETDNTRTHGRKKVQQSWRGRGQRNTLVRRIVGLQFGVEIEVEKEG